MPAHPATPLRENPGAAQTGAKVIDANYAIVGAKKGGVWSSIKSGLSLIFWFAVVGFLIPPAWLALKWIGEATNQ